jgi:hypothetical protein
MEYKHSNGQYFTTNSSLQECVYKFILNHPICILEPSVGQGDLVSYIQSKIQNVEFDMYEIDRKIPILE